MVKLNIPFIPDNQYLDFLLENQNQLCTLHYSLYDRGLQDARIHLDLISVEKLIDALRPFKKVKKYLLANGRFQPNSLYGGGRQMQDIIEKLDCLLVAGQLHGVIFSDSYFLTALGDAAPSLAASLEAVPSVNFQIDILDKLAANLEFISLCGFMMPAKITLDRGLNRRDEQLFSLTAAIRKRWPELQLELLANEGCLHHCVSRQTHEALISLANCCGAGIDTKRLNDNLACVRRLHEAPYRVLGSPFIRPEDLCHFEDEIDVFKICGRTLGPSFLQQTVAAYIKREWNKNLLELLDACHWMADIWDLPNAALPRDFLEKTMRCGHDCVACTYCKELFARLAAKKAWTITDKRNLSRFHGNQ